MADFRIIHHHARASSRRVPDHNIVADYARLNFGDPTPKGDLPNLGMRLVCPKTKRPESNQDCQEKKEERSCCFKFFHQNW
jgi:hypothetical protein